jgi:hypothetical protein
MAEVYWDLEWILQQQGFAYCYDKRLYDRLRDGHAAPVRGHLLAGLDYQDKLARFLENHDEPRAARSAGSTARPGVCSRRSSALPRRSGRPTCRSCMPRTIPCGFRVRSPGDVRSERRSALEIRPSSISDRGRRRSPHPRTSRESNRQSGGMRGAYCARRSHPAIRVRRSPRPSVNETRAQRARLMRAATHKTRFERRTSPSAAGPSKRRSSRH